MKNHVHIVNGDSAAGIVQLAIMPNTGNLLVNIDPISCGPLPNFTSLDEWTRIRHKFIGSLYAYDPDFHFLENEQDILHNCDRLKEAEEVYLWMGTGLADQLLCVWIIRLFKVISADIDKLKLVQLFQSGHGKFEVVSIGLLNPEGLSNHSAPKALTKESLAYLETAWRALSGSDPEALISLMENHDGPLPLFRRSLGVLLGRFPHYKTGLTYWDKELLNSTTQKGPAAAGIIAHTIGRHSNCLDRLGDDYLFHRLHRLGDARLKQPLVELEGSRAAMRDTVIYLSDAGRHVRSGVINNVVLNGIDEWICGIHLSSDRGNIWYRRNNTIVAG